MDKNTLSQAPNSFHPNPKTELLIRRAIAACVDFFAILLPVFVIFFTFSILSLIASFLDALLVKEVLTYLAAFVASAISSGFILLKDTLKFGNLLDNRSIGKTLMHLRVININGQQIDYKSSIKRNLILVPGCIIPVLTFIPIIGSYIVLLVLIFALGLAISEIVLLIKNPELRRRGDMQANTKVIYSKE